MDWIYLSPHLDDAAFSCGGLIWEQARAGAGVQVWTICAGDPPRLPLSAFAQSLHARWGAGLEAVALRREEDRLACRRLGATNRHFAIPDAIYRRDPEVGNPIYVADEDLFKPLPGVESGLVEELSRQLDASLPPESRLVCPLGLGNHIDHQLVRAAAEQLGKSPWYYADLPYALQDVRLLGGSLAGMRSFTFPVTQGGMAAWEASAAAYTSQISTFWPGVAAMQAELRTYCHKMTGVRLWKHK